jgi:hypothetical protein
VYHAIAHDLKRKGREAVVPTSGIDDSCSTQFRAVAAMTMRLFTGFGLSSTIDSGARPMQRTSSAFRVATTLLAIVFLGGCTTYYRVTDPVSGKSYYSTSVDQNKSGVTKLVDARTGSKVTIQNSEISEISKDEYNAAKAVK